MTAADRDVAAPRARRRLRRAVRAADRAPRARGRRLQRDRAAHGIRRRDRGEEPGRHHPLAAVRRRCTSRARPRSTRASSTSACPTLGICYGFQVMAQALGGEVANTGLREYGATDAALTRRRRRAARRPAGRAERVDEPRRLRSSKAPEGFEVLASTRGHPGRRVRQRRAPPVRRAVAPRGQALRLRPARASRTSCTRPRASPPTGTAATSSPSRSRASARRSAPAA